MKNLVISALIPMLVVSAYAQQGFQAEALLVRPDGKSFRAWVLATTATDIRFKTTAVSTTSTDAKIADFSTIYLDEPAEYTEAMDLFEARKYKQAQELFAGVKDTYRPVATLKNNYHTLAAFYEMESMRKLGNLEGLATALQSFTKEPLVRDDHLRQLELYVMWDAARAESWDKLLAIASGRDAEDLPGYQRAQVAYNKGLALQNLDRPEEALLEYAIAMTADAGSSEQIAKDAALNSLRIYHQDEEVQLAIANWGTENEKRTSPGFTRLTEAAALAAFYEKFLQTGAPLPENLRQFLKFTA